MYAEFFGLRELPFNITPDPRFLYLNDCYQEALAALGYGIDARKGFISLIGDAGTGKTTLLRRLLDTVGPMTRTVLLLNPTVGFDEIVASPFAAHLAAQTEDKDPRAVEVILRETKRIVRMDRGHLICETRHGWVCANAGVDESNGVAAGVLTLLPRDADASAAALCERLRQRFGVELAVVVTDTFGRPWREGLVEVALGCAGMDPLLDLRGRADLTGRTLHHTVVALADEVAAAAGLVMEKDSAVAAAIVRGVRYTPGPGGAATRLVRKPEFDLFR